jgi:uncharacterized protein (TIGR02231 family)
VRLASFAAEAEVDLVALAELVPAVLLRSRQTNAGTVPILAGPVDLVRSGGLMGRTSVLYVAPGERFALGWGPEPELRVQRESESTNLGQKVLSSWETRRTHVVVRLSNLGPRSHQIAVTERIPVSEIDKVVIEPDTQSTTDGATPDGDGLVRWDVTLAPFARRSLTLDYAVRKHADVKGL